MYYQVATKLYVVSGGTAYLQAVSMEGANAAFAEFTNYAAGTASVFIEPGNDLREIGVPQRGQARPPARCSERQRQPGSPLDTCGCVSRPRAGR